MSTIISEAKLKQIALHMSDMVHAFNSERHSTTCDILPSLPAGKRIQITWRLHVFHRYHVTLLDVILMVAGHFRLSSSEEKVEFRTYHDVSVKGIRSIYMHRFVGVIIALFSYLLFFCGLIGFSISILGWLLHWVGPKSDGRSITDLIFSTIVPIAIVWTGLAGRKWAHSYSIPGGIKQIGRWPIEYVKFRYEPDAVSII